MSLYLGRLGRKIVNFSITNKTAGKILDGFGRGINRLSSKYVAGLTRESFMLSQRAKAGDNVDVKADGFSVGEQQVLPSARLAHSLLNSGISTFNVDNTFLEPENLARAFRTVLARENPLQRTVYTLSTFLLSFGVDQAAKLAAEKGVFFNTCVRHYLYYSERYYSELNSIYQSHCLLPAVREGAGEFSFTKFLLPLTVPFLISLYYAASKKATLWQKLGSGLMFGGVASNTFDIVRQGYAIDYLSGLNIDFLPSSIPLINSIFNLADVSIWSGFLVVLISGMIKLRNKPSSIS